MKDNVLLFLKGVLMGICDLIPGISGGTIAFVTGIYLRLINAVKNISFKLIIDLLNPKKFKSVIKKADLGFLMVLALGIGTAVLAGSRIIIYVLDRYFAFALSFFVGLILSSSKIIYDHIENHTFKNIFFGFIGLLFGVLLSFFVPAEFTPNLLIVFFGGFFAISAMFLPGISGAFILLIMGLYEFMLNVLHNLLENITYFITFIFGALLGMATISRLISFLFRKDKCRTLYVLLGLVIGALSTPLKNIYSVSDSLSIFGLIVVVLFFLLGILSVITINSFVKKEGHQSQSFIKQ